MAIVDEIKESFKKGSNLVKLIYINLAVFVIVKIISAIRFLFGLEQIAENPISKWLAVPANGMALLEKPWTIITYMFYHEGFLHILFNLLWLYWFGIIFLRYFDQKKLLNIYLLGGLSGAALYIAAFNIFPAFQNIVVNPEAGALGASASVIAVCMAISFYAPNHSINLIFIGPIKLKYIAAVLIILDIISIKSFNSGGHIAHLGGALFGYLFTRQYKKGKYLGKNFSNFLDSFFSIFKPRKKMKVTYKKPVDDYEYNKMKVDKQKEIDKILDKIAKSGYKSLTKDEKEKLFKMSNDS